MDRLGIRHIPQHQNISFVCIAHSNLKLCMPDIINQWIPCQNGDRGNEYKVP